MRSIAKEKKTNWNIDMSPPCYQHVNFSRSQCFNAVIKLNDFSMEISFFNFALSIENYLLRNQNHINRENIHWKRTCIKTKSVLVFLGLSGVWCKDQNKFFLNQLSSATVMLSIETLVRDVRPVVTEKNEFSYQKKWEKSKVEKFGQSCCWHRDQNTCLLEWTLPY